MLTLYFLLIGHKLLRLGTHGDGVEYASVAGNMADGVRTFWKSYLDDSQASTRIIQSSSILKKTMEPQGGRSSNFEINTSKMGRIHIMI